MAIVNYSGLDLETGGLQEINEISAIPTFLTLGSTATRENTGDKLGGPCRKFTPPTGAGGYSGYGQFILNKAGTFGFRRMAMRFEMQIGATWGTRNVGDAVKLLIINMTDTLGGNTTTRPMLYLDSRPGDGADGTKPTSLIGLGLAQGTNKRYSATATVDYMDGSTPFFFGPTSGTWDGRPVVGADEWVSISYYMNSQAEAGWPNGRLWMKVTRQDGTVLADFSHSYTIGANSPDDFIAVMDILGGYFNFAATAQEPTNYIRIAHPSFLSNANAPLGPRTGFVTAATLPALTPELTGWTRPNDTSLRSPDGETEIGDVQQPVFYPQFKRMKWANESNFSIRPVFSDYTADALLLDRDTVVYRHGIYTCRIRLGSWQTPRGERFGANFEIEVSSRPPSDSLDFTVNSKGAVLTLQPPLHAGPKDTDQTLDVEVAPGVTRRRTRYAQYINSILVEHPTARHNQYETGNIGYLHRPQMIDALGVSTWGDWEIINQTLIRMTFPTAALDSATYPVRWS